MLQVRQSLADRLHTAYDMDLDDIDTAWASFVPDASKAILAGQETAKVVAQGFSRYAISTALKDPWEPVESDVKVGVTEEGRPIADALDAIPSMMKNAISASRQPGEVLAMGLFLTFRLGDNEIMSIADREVFAQAKRAGSAGWEGIVSASACGRCTGNAGFHSFDERMYRHSSCACSMSLVIR